MRSPGDDIWYNEAGRHSSEFGAVETLVPRWHGATLEVLRQI